MTSFDYVNSFVDYWFYEIGANLIPCVRKEKKVWIQWKKYQDQPISEEQLKQWKDNGDFKNGLAILTGRLYRGPNKGLYLNGIDCDNGLAVNEILTKNGKAITLQELAKWTIVECHKDDLSKIHLYVLSTKPFKSKSSSNTSLWK